VRSVVIFLLLAGYVLFSCQYVSFSGTANDLARHLRDGELILGGKAGEIFHKNYYSYTHPGAVFINHHWLMTVLFYLVYKMAGLSVLNAFYIALGALTSLLYFRIAEQEAGLLAATAFAAVLMPLLAVRAGIRPEVFSSLLLGVFFLILWEAYRGRLSQKWLWLLPVLELFWANLHPGFLLGPILLATFFVLELGLRQKGGPGPWNLRTLGVVTAVTFLAGLANPNGVFGWIFPVAVANNYAMPVRENLSPFALSADRMATAVEIAVAALFASWILVYLRKARIEWPLLLFSLGVAGMTLLFFRVYVFLSGVALVTLCVNVRALQDLKKGKGTVPMVAGILIFAIALLNGAVTLKPRWDDIGLDLAPHDDDLAQFMSANRISGRVFNSYPSGGYLIHYSPGQQVYIDNRPEAYPGDFIRDEYLLPLEDEDAWHRIVSKYNFDYIFFVRVNQDEAKFLLRRIHDPEWAAVWAGTQMVLVRRAPRFAAVIAAHEVKF
jgi:hypothetical protein